MLGSDLEAQRQKSPGSPQALGPHGLAAQEPQNEKTLLNFSGLKDHSIHFVRARSKMPCFVKYIFLKTVM